MDFCALHGREIEPGECVSGPEFPEDREICQTCAQARPLVFDLPLEQSPVEEAATRVMSNELALAKALRELESLWPEHVPLPELYSSWTRLAAAQGLESMRYPSWVAFVCRRVSCEAVSPEGKRAVAWTETTRRFLG